MKPKEYLDSTIGAWQGPPLIDSVDYALGYAWGAYILNLSRGKPSNDLERGIIISLGLVMGLKGLLIIIVCRS